MVFMSHRFWISIYLVLNTRMEKCMLLIFSVEIKPKEATYSPVERGLGPQCLAVITL